MDEFCDEKVISKIKDIISAHLRNDGWAELASVGAALNLNGINLKEKGYKVKSFFANLSEDFELTTDNMTSLPLVRLRCMPVLKTNIVHSCGIPKKETLHLTKWANINQKAAIESLSIFALPERWTYKEENVDYPNPILAKYLKWTFVKILREDKILYANNRYAAFNTGLVDKFYKPIYAVFDKNKVPNKQPWHFVDFCVAGSSTLASRILADNFPKLPLRATYIKSYDDVMYDCSLPVDVNWEHIVLENIDRLPMVLLQQICHGAFDIKDVNRMPKEQKDCYMSELINFLEKNPMRLSLISNMMNMAVEIAKLRVEWNYKTAIPVYYPTDDKVHLILPLALNINEPEEISLALVMTKTPANRYRAVTIFTLDMAYSNARLITKPSSDWLIVDSISME